MKVLFATMQFGRGYAQGTERYVAMLVEGLQQRGHEAVILAGDPEGRGPKLNLGEPVQDDPRVLHYPSRGWMSVEGVSPRDLVRLLNRERPDVVHVANPAHIGIGLLAAAGKSGIPAVVTVMDFWWICPKHTLLDRTGRVCPGNVGWRECLRCIAAADSRSWLRPLARSPGLSRLVLPALYFGKSMLRGVSGHERSLWRKRAGVILPALQDCDVIFPSYAARERLKEYVKPDRQHPIPYGLEPRWFGMQRSRRWDGPINPAELTIGYAGALAAHKGPHLLLKALQQLGWSRTRVRIAGGGTDKLYIEHLHELARGLNVEFVGRVASADMPAFLGDLDLFVMPSIWPENLPIVVLEAQAVGTPVMASRIDGVTETVPERMLFKAGSATALDRKLEAWARDPIHPPPLQPVSTAEAMVERTLDVYGVATGQQKER
jgi:glycosyltransferase involved in cell wall biosynthesis